MLIHHHLLGRSKYSKLLVCQEIMLCKTIDIIGKGARLSGKDRYHLYMHLAVAPSNGAWIEIC